MYEIIRRDSGNAIFRARSYVDALAWVGADDDYYAIVIADCPIRAARKALAPFWV